jgi:hypothetical protein
VKKDEIAALDGQCAENVLSPAPLVDYAPHVAKLTLPASERRTKLQLTSPFPIPTLHRLHRSLAALPSPT